MNDMVVRLKGDNVAEQIATKMVELFSVKIKEEVIKQIYPAEFKGFEKAGMLVGGISADAMRRRYERGFYKEGLHFYKKNDKMVIWKRDPLLNDERSK